MCRQNEGRFRRPACAAAPPSNRRSIGEPSQRRRTVAVKRPVAARKRGAPVFQRVTGVIVGIRMYPVNLPSDRDNGHVPLRIASCKVRHDWETAVRYVAEILGLTFETVDFDWNTPAVPADLRPNVGVMKAGTICAHRWRLAGKVGDAAVVSVQYFAALSSTPWPDVWPRPVAEVASAVVYRVAGRPNLRMRLCFDPQDGKANLNSAIPLAAMATVNAIPFVVEADPGLHRRSLGRDASRGLLTI